MNTTLSRLGVAFALAAGLAVVVSACGGGGGYGGPSTPTNPSNPGVSTATVTIRAGGTVDPKEVRIEVGQQVRFVNEDSQARHVQSNPHMQHNECPQANVPVVNPGQSVTTATFTTARSCGYHDHMDAEKTSMHGTIRVGGDNTPTGPVYVVHH